MLCLFVLMGCGASKPQSARNTPIVIPAGHEISVMLLTPLESGGTPKGEVATFVVASDVMVGDRIAVPQGTQVKAIVTNSRGAGAMSSMLNQPARLAIEFEPINLGSVSIPLENPDKKGSAVYTFSRENTGIPANSFLASALQDDNKRAALSELADLVENASADGSRIDDRRLREMVDELNLSHVKSMLDASDAAGAKSDELAGVLRALRTGATLSTGDIGLALGAIEELGGVAGEVTGTLKGIFKGRNIRAHVGTKVRLLVPSDVHIGY